jgi:hypothetical protein
MHSNPLRQAGARPSPGRQPFLFMVFVLTLVASACSSSHAAPATADAVHADDAGPTDSLAAVDAAQDVSAIADAVFDTKSDAADAAADTVATPPPTIQRWGVRLRAPVLALRTVERSLWLGMTAIPDPEDPSKIRAGLARYDLDTGEVVRYEAELPQVVYDDFAVKGPGPVSTAAAIGDGSVVPDGRAAASPRDPKFVPGCPTRRSWTSLSFEGGAPPPRRARGSPPRIVRSRGPANP